MSETSAAADIPVVILCGGMGTRIRDVTDAVPKPLIDVGGRPILWHIMKTYDHFGFRRFVLCLGYRSFDIKQYFLRYRENLADFTLHLKGDHDAVFRNEVGNEDWEVTCVETGLNTATGGRVGRVRRTWTPRRSCSRTATASAASTSVRCSRTIARKAGSGP